ncbi:multisubunit sodium/proton antiporter, MrpE subunit [Natronincola peptidivorans]|uniref:Multisubunit sodium/proton antiporter, MrpE subunit n=1 Tax=Natronincola peptidivorans TaxID=426128 RepID=A0A1I0BJ03_9FIRM|nr:Na+/H+ antiporter subunit E [Natronincola peptidivorans]SET06873.1 multisubunit sodium/proton antiporter, MrpE subunit [Natronincola peptidivorans]
MEGKKSWVNKKNVCLFTLLLLFWFVLAPELTIETIMVGAIACSMVVLYSQDIIFGDKEMPLYSLKKLKIFVRFLATLLIEIVKANIEVAIIVLNPAMPIKPSFIRVPMMLKNDVNKVIYGNSVTLTPGTLTVDITDDEFIIHALTESAAASMEGSFIEEYVSKMEGDTK